MALPNNFNQIETTSKKNADGEIINPTPQDIANYNSQYTTYTPAKKTVGILTSTPAKRRVEEIRDNVSNWMNNINSYLSKKGTTPLNTTTQNTPATTTQQTPPPTIEQVRGLVKTGEGNNFYDSAAKAGFKDPKTMEQELQTAYQRSIIEGKPMSEVKDATGKITNSGDLANLKYAMEKLGWQPKEQPSQTDQGTTSGDQQGLPEQPKSPFETYKDQLDTVNKQFDDLLTSATKDLDGIKNGTFTLSPAEQAQVQSLQDSYNRQIEEEKRANENYQNAMRQIGYSTGASRYTPEQQATKMRDIIANGARKISDLEAKSAQAINELNSSLQEKKYKKVDDYYKNVQELMKQKKDSIQEMYKMTQEEMKYAQEETKRKQDEATALLNQQKLKQEIGKSTVSMIAPSIAESLTGKPELDSNTISTLAKYYNIDPLALQSGATEYSNKQQKATKTNTQVIKTGKYSYALMDKNTGKIINSNVDSSWNTVKSNYTANTAKTSSSSSKTIKLTKEEQKFDTDLKNARKLLASGKSWGSQWDYLKEQYNVPNEVLDQMLNKDKYYKQSGKKGSDSESLLQ
jgi:hypothetical protein